MMHHTPWIQRARDYQVGFQPSMSPPPPASASLSSSHHSSNLSRSSHRSSHTHSRSRSCTYHSVGVCPTQGSSNAQDEGTEERGEDGDGRPHDPPQYKHSLQPLQKRMHSQDRWSRVGRAPYSLLFLWVMPLPSSLLPSLLPSRPW